MSIDIEIDTCDTRLAFDILEKSSARRKDKINIGKNIELECQGTFMRLSEGAPETIKFVLEISGGITSITMFAAWLYDKIKNKALKLRIDRTEIDINEGEITRIITEKIEKK